MRALPPRHGDGQLRPRWRRSQLLLLLCGTQRAVFCGSSVCSRDLRSSARGCNERSGPILTTRLVTRHCFGVLNETWCFCVVCACVLYFHVPSSRFARSPSSVVGSCVVFRFGCFALLSAFAMSPRSLCTHVSKSWGVSCFRQRFLRCAMVLLTSRLPYETTQIRSCSVR